jgi:hypothetical protein
VGYQQNRPGRKDLKTYSTSKSTPWRGQLWRENKKEKKICFNFASQAKSRCIINLNPSQQEGREATPAVSRQLLCFANHAVQFANISVVVTVHLLDEVKPHCLIDLHIRNVARTFQIASLSFRIGYLGHLSRECFAYSSSLLFYP